MRCAAMVMPSMTRYCSTCLATRLGHINDRCCYLAQQRQDRRGEVQAATASATGLACFIFRFLRRPLLA